MIRVAAYCRVSTDSADQANSFASQQRFFREYISRNPQWALSEVYADEGITGTSTRKREAFNRMLRDAEAGAFSLILTKEVSRFSRNILDTIQCTRRLRAMGIGVLFLTENLNSLDPEAELLLTFMGVLAQEESRRTSVRVKWGQTRRMEQGVVFGHSLLGYRASGGRLTVIPEQAELVRLIFQKYAIEGKGTAAIARELQEAGYRTASGGSVWHVSHIVKILKNEKYVGDLIQKKSVTPDYLTHAKRPNNGQEALVTLRDHHEAIIPRPLFDAAQARLARRAPARQGSSDRFLFSGRIICGLCGAAFVSRTGNGHRRWVCGSAVRGRGCAIGRLVRDDDALAMLQAALDALPLDPELLVRSVLERLPSGDHLEKLRRRRDALLARKDAALDAYCAGDLTRAELQRLKSSYLQQAAELDRQIQAAQPLQEANIRQCITDALTRGSEPVYRAVLESLTVFPDRHMELRLKGLPHVFCFR